MARKRASQHRINGLVGRGAEDTKRYIVTFAAAHVSAKLVPKHGSPAAF
jgi:hypothetical protein